MYSTRILLDSISPAGKRIITYELTYPRFIHAELMTHRLFSRNSASSRAIPVKTMLDYIRNDPAMPVFWGKNQSGMQAAEELQGQDRKDAIAVWMAARDSAVQFAEDLMKCNLHKQIANRVTEPWMFITVLVTSTEWDNWDQQRDSEFAQPEIAWVARDMKAKRALSVPQVLQPGEWHLPLIQDITAEERAVLGIERLKRISAGRCARVSYLTHDGKRDFDEDIGLCERLTKNGHWSPLEHVAQCLSEPARVGNFIGFRQFRKEFENEHPTQIEAPYIEGSVTFTPRERDVLLTFIESVDPWIDDYDEIGVILGKLRG